VNESVTNETKVFDVKAAAEYMRSLGFSAATVGTVRRLVADKRLPVNQIGRRFYINREALDRLVTQRGR
jgi:excisionase family DNA binding protein